MVEHSEGHMYVAEAGVTRQRAVGNYDLEYSALNQALRIESVTKVEGRSSFWALHSLPIDLSKFRRPKNVSDRFESSVFRVYEDKELRA